MLTPVLCEARLIHVDPISNRRLSGSRLQYVVIPTPRPVALSMIVQGAIRPVFWSESRRLISFSIAAGAGIVGIPGSPQVLRSGRIRQIIAVFCAKGLQSHTVVVEGWSGRKSHG